jgi:hypothetical protein
MNRDLLKAMILEQLKGAAVQRVMESDKYKAWKEKHGETGSKYVDSKGVEHDDPWDSEEKSDPTPEDDKELELELEE